MNKRIGGLTGEAGSGIEGNPSQKGTEVSGQHDPMESEDLHLHGPDQFDDVDDEDDSDSERSPDELDGWEELPPPVSGRRRKFVSRRVAKRQTRLQTYEYLSLILRSVTHSALQAGWSTVL